jgi:hypothetical protein
MPPFRTVFPAFAFLVPALAFAQAQPGGGTTPAPPTAAPATTGTGGATMPAGTATAPAPAAGGTAAPAASGGAATGQDDQPKQPVTTPATGYGYDDKPAARGRTGGAAPRRVTMRAAGPVATLPGFEMLADGSSRLFVQLTQNVPVEEKRAAGTVTYVLKGAHVTKYNNERPLVTVHFNTPVSRARLIPSGHDLLFIVDLRANVQPTWKIENAKDNTAILAIDFPKGDFIPSGPVAPTDDTEQQQQQQTPRPRRSSKKKG